MSHDRKFFDTFMLILGALILFSVAMIVLAKFIGARQGEFIAEDPAVIGQLEERIKPFGSVAVAGQVDTVAQELAADEPPPASAATAMVAAATAAPSGEDTYQGACALCHDMGLAGAPKVGDVAQWAARITKGNDALYANAVNGYQGAAGVMPAKGGRMDLSDDAVRAAVDYMVSNSQ